MARLTKPLTVVQEAPSGFVRERWVFSLVGDCLVLDRYYYERRFAKNQPLKVVKFYDRLRDLDEEDYGSWQWLTEEEVPWDEELTIEARSELMTLIRVVRKSEL